MDSCHIPEVTNTLLVNPDTSVTLTSAGYSDAKSSTGLSDTSATLISDDKSSKGLSDTSATLISDDKSSTGLSDTSAMLASDGKSSTGLGSEEEEKAAGAWLASMKLFCEELQLLMKETPTDARIQEFSSAAACSVIQKDPSKYKHLLILSENQHISYMEGIPRIPNKDLQASVKELCTIMSQTYLSVAQHPTFNVFQGDPETRVSAFFEKVLCMCMALGTEAACS
jgi:hypothetical protein